jgi:hypothetical protein
VDLWHVTGLYELFSITLWVHLAFCRSLFGVENCQSPSPQLVFVLQPSRVNFVRIFGVSSPTKLPSISNKSAKSNTNRYLTAQLPFIKWQVHHQSRESGANLKIHFIWWNFFLQTGCSGYLCKTWNLVNSWATSASCFLMWCKLLPNALQMNEVMHNAVAA